MVLRFEIAQRRAAIGTFGKQHRGCPRRIEKGAEPPRFRARQIGKMRRVLPVDPQEDGAMNQAINADLDAEILRAEMRQALRDGLAELPKRDQWLLQLRSSDPPKSYHEISEMLDMPVGSIGPTLRRCLDRLRDTAAMQRYVTAGSPADRGKGGDQRELAEVD